MGLDTKPPPADPEAALAGDGKPLWIKCQSHRLREWRKKYRNFSIDGNVDQTRAKIYCAWLDPNSVDFRGLWD